jgi:hypothetical protein
VGIGQRHAKVRATRSQLRGRPKLPRQTHRAERLILREAKRPPGAGILGDQERRVEGAVVSPDHALRQQVREVAHHVNLTVAMGRMEAMAEVVMASDQAVIAPLRELLIEARAVGDADVPDIDLTAAMVLGGITMAVIQRYSMTGEIDADALAESVTAQVMNGVRVR